MTTDSSGQRCTYTSIFNSTCTLGICLDTQCEQHHFKYLNRYAYCCACAFCLPFGKQSFPSTSTDVLSVPYPAVQCNLALRTFNFAIKLRALVGQCSHVTSLTNQKCFVAQFKKVLIKTAFCIKSEFFMILKKKKSPVF